MPKYRLGGVFFAEVYDADGPVKLSASRAVDSPHPVRGGQVPSDSCYGSALRLDAIERNSPTVMQKFTDTLMWVSAHTKS